jgi:membrane protease YdiL (CAAX protease family)
VTAAPGRWGPWATVLAAAAVAAVFIGAQTWFYMAYVSATRGKLPSDRLVAELAKAATHGDVVAIATILSALAGLLAIIAAVKFKRGATLEDALALRMPPLPVLVRWMLVLLAFAALSDALTWILGKPIVPIYVKTVFASAESKSMLWVAIVVAAPVFEEVFFRGLLVTGLAASRLGASGAVILSAAAWAAIHTQYDAYGMATIFVLGLLLGAARVRTNSVALPVLMHMAVNLISSIEAALS